MEEKNPNEILSNIWNSKNAVVQNQFYHAKYLILLPHNFIISVLYFKKKCDTLIPLHFHFNGEKWYMYIVHVNVEKWSFIVEDKKWADLKRGYYFKFFLCRCTHLLLLKKRIRKIKLLILWACPHVLLTFILTSLYINSFIIILYHAIPIDSDT